MTPWDSIHSPSNRQEIITRRVDGTKSAEFWWFRDGLGRVGLLLSMTLETESLQRLPVFRDMLVERVELPKSAHLRWTLLDHENHEVFLAFCNSLLDNCLNLEGRTAIDRAIGQTNSWKRLLSIARNPLLSVQEQLGLLGEIITLELLINNGIEQSRVVKGWTGPDGNPKDFILGRVALETKAVTSSMRNSVRISSEHQLDTLSHQTLFLIVIEADQDSGEEGLTIQEWAAHLERKLEGPEIIRYYKNRLLNSGLIPEHDYSGQKWVVLGSRQYLVDDNFPRIATTNIMQGIENVSYSLSLLDLTNYNCNLDTLCERLSRKV